MLKINEYFYHLQGKDLFVQKNHSHDEIELIQVVNGNGFVLKNDRTYELKSGYLYVIDARKTHIVYPQSENCEDYIRNKIIIGADSFVEFFSDIGLGDAIDNILNSDPIYTLNTPEIDSIYKEVTELCGTKRKEMIAKAHAGIIELIYRINSSLSSKPLAEEKSTLQKMLDVINKTDGVISLEQISKTIYMNKHYLSHLFKEKTGITLNEYLSNKVYERICNLLEGTSYSTERIALLCGFSSASSLTRFFKNKSGITPTKYRKERLISKFNIT